MPHKWQSCLSCHTQTNQQLLTVVTEQSTELEMLQNQLRYVNPSHIQGGCYYSFFCPHTLWFSNKVLNIKMEIWIHGHLLCCSLFNASSFSLFIVLSPLFITCKKNRSVAMASTSSFLSVRWSEFKWLSGMVARFQDFSFFLFPADVNYFAVCLTRTGIPRLSRRQPWSSWKTWWNCKRKPKTGWRDW